ncbi:MAG: tetratricopeptide repeat protein [Prevotella sp.]|nr:tetratricopeptide repeat protein [Prevotella sp.]MBQ6187492.1 tetratricopeptide repeat protein [Prevotella sp.]
MKKLMILALMFVATSAAFAGDSPALKAIMAAKNYAEAESLMKSSLTQLVGAAEKAKAYNKLVDLALEAVSKEQAIIDKNYAAKALKPDAQEEPYDEDAFFMGSYNAVKNAVECDKYDQEPNEKGKVKPKFFQANAARLTNARLQLINAGQKYISEQAKALDMYGLYVETNSHPLFKEAIEKLGGDEYIGEVARVASVLAFQEKDLARANKYCDVALTDKGIYDQAIGLKTYLMTQGLQTREDSVACVKELETLYQRENGNEQVFSVLASMYDRMKETAALDKIIADKIASNPQSYTAWALKGQTEMNSKKHEEALASFKKALEIAPEDPLILTYVGYTYGDMAREKDTEAEVKAMFSEAVPYLEKARQLDPTQEKARWSLPLYNCYYILYGENDTRTKEMEKLREY